VVPSNNGAGNGNDDTGRKLVIGSVGEIDPDVAATFGLTRTSGSTAEPRRIGWLEVDLGLLFDEVRVPRRHVVASAVSRFPSSDIDLAFVVDDRYATDVVADTVRTSAGDLLESVRLFDVYRGAGIAEGARSLAYRLRFCSPVRTLTDEEVGELRARCIEAVEREFGATLR
jgi:phenylalanyl-tRNA synthetase beta chain